METVRDFILGQTIRRYRERIQVLEDSVTGSEFLARRIQKEIDLLESDPSELKVHCDSEALLDSEYFQAARFIPIDDEVGKESNYSNVFILNYGSLLYFVDSVGERHLVPLI